MTTSATTPTATPTDASPRMLRHDQVTISLPEGSHILLSLAGESETIDLTDMSATLLGLGVQRVALDAADADTAGEVAAEETPAPQEGTGADSTIGTPAADLDSAEETGPAEETNVEFGELRCSDDIVFTFAGLHLTQDQALELMGLAIVDSLTAALMEPAAGE